MEEQIISEVYKKITHVSNCTLEGMRLCISSFFTIRSPDALVRHNKSIFD